MIETIPLITADLVPWNAHRVETETVSAAGPLGTISTWHRWTCACGDSSGRKMWRSRTTAAQVGQKSHLDD